jgi:hypothetical protein
MPQRAPQPDNSIIPLKPDLDPAPSDDDDVYDGDLYQEPSVLWRWAKRAIVLAVLGGGGWVAYSTWRTWLPKAETFGVGVVAAIDQKVRPPSPPAPSAEEVERKEREDALAVATEHLPHLTPEAIQHLMAESINGVLEPPEVFRRAQDAVDRGRAELAAEEAQELSTLQNEVLAVLGPGERAAMKTYEDVRRARVTLQFEDRNALTIFARAARALPAPNLERLRQLSGKAIAAAPPSPGPSPAAAAEASPS